MEEKIEFPILKPIPLPYYAFLMVIDKPVYSRPVDKLSYKRFCIRKKWKVTSAIKEQYRVDRDSIMQYDWCAEFQLRYHKGVTIKISFNNAYRGYQVNYRNNGESILTLMIDYKDMTTFFLQALISDIIPVKYVNDNKPFEERGPGQPDK